MTGRWTGRGLGTIGASGQWQQLCAARGTRVCNRRVRSCTQRTARVSELIGRGGESGHVRPDASGR
jgi:hypothetical protein